MKNVISDICAYENISLITYKRLTGGDINDVFLLTTNSSKLVLKINSNFSDQDMFSKEAMSLKLLASTHTFIVPKPITYNTINHNKYLLLEYVEPVNSNISASNFGSTLANLHLNTSSTFGLDYDNYIGSLPQYNNKKFSKASEFYINLRLEPQFEMAINNGYTFKRIEKFYKTIEQLIPNEKASLIHGDLWSGNYFITHDTKACVFDPAISYAPREMDIAMMKLFGSVPEKVLKDYDFEYPLIESWKNRIPIWQLYYLLVHLNLFGDSYYHSVNQIIEKYSQ